MAAHGAAEEDRELVADQLAATVGKDGWMVGETLPGTIWLFLAEGHLTRREFVAILRRIWALPLPVG